MHKIQILILGVVSLVSLSAHADLNSVANNYSLSDPMNWEKVIGWSEYSQSLLFSKSQLANLEQVTETSANSALLNDLKKYYQSELGLDSQCQPFSWSAFPIMYVTQPLNVQTLDQYSDLNAFYVGYEETLKALGENLFSYYERLEAGLDNSLLPHGQIHELLTAPGAPLFGMESFIASLPSSTCSYCSSIDPKKLQSLYDLHVAPYEYAIAQLIQTFPKYDPGFISSPVSIRKQCYDFIVKHIYSDITPQMILRKGNIELHRSELQMLFTAQDLGYQLHPPESLAAFIKRVYDTMAAKPEYSLTGAQAHQDYFNALYKRAEYVLPLMTSKKMTLPLDYVVETLPGEAGAGTAWTAGYYLDETTLKGTFSLYLFGDKGMKTFEAASLFFHEGIPGHHLERENAFLVNQSLTKFEKENYYSPYTEGWGLYSEELALEFGLYTSKEEVFAFWDLQRLRALRLNVSYMYFYENWTQAEGEKFFEEHTFGDSFQAKINAERPRDWSGQGLGYMIGKTVILGLRDSYANDVGFCYSLPEFNDFILAQGGTYLDTLVRQYSLWIVNHKCALPNLDPKLIESQARARILKRF